MTHQRGECRDCLAWIAALGRGWDALTPEERGDALDAAHLDHDAEGAPSGLRHDTERDEQ